VLLTLLAEEVAVVPGINPVKGVEAEPLAGFRIAGSIGELPDILPARMDVREESEEVLRVGVTHIPDDDQVGGPTLTSWLAETEIAFPTNPFLASEQYGVLRILG
jgi:hypothetical protein